MWRCQTKPLDRQRFGVEIDGRMVTVWNFEESSPRPYFYPIRGPQGGDLTRMGHPGAYDHDHHCSVWFAHNKVMGVDFWADESPARIKQTRWLSIDDGDERTAFSVDLVWQDGHDPAPLLNQRLIVVAWRDEHEQWQLEIQTDLVAERGQVELMKSNYGVLAVRMAKSISTYFGGGVISNSEGAVGESEIFGRPSRWMDYSGSVGVGQGTERKQVDAGITYFDHAENTSYPSKWHVREDGWMGASVCRDSGIVLDPGDRLRLRYLLDLHKGRYDQDRALRLSNEFSDRPAWQLVKSTRPNVKWEIQSSTTA